MNHRHYYQNKQIQTNSRMQHKQDEQEEIFHPYNRKVAVSYCLLSSISWIISTFLLIWMVLKQYGVFTSSPLQISTCTSSYFDTKYSNTSIFVTMFVFLSLSVLITLILTIVWISNVIKHRVSWRIKYLTVILESIKCLSSAVFLGFCLTFLIEISKMDSSSCSVSYASDILILFIGIGAANFVLSLVRYVIAATREFVSQKDMNQNDATNKNYQSLVNVTNQSFRENQNKVKQKYNAIKQQNYPQKALSRVSKTQNKIRYIGQRQIIKSEQWEKYAPSRVSQKAQPKKVQQKKDTPLIKNKSYQPKKQSTFQDNINQNIFLDNQNQSQNQSLFIPQQPFYYKSLAAQTLGRYDRNPSLLKTTSMDKIQPIKRQRQIFELQQSQQEMKQSDLKSIKVRPQKLNYHFPKASKQNYERRLNIKF